MLIQYWYWSWQTCVQEFVDFCRWYRYFIPEHERASVCLQSSTSATLNTLYCSGFFWFGSIQNNSGSAPPAARHENCLSVSVCACVCVLPCVFLHAFNSQHAQALDPVSFHSGPALLHPAANMTVTSPSILSPPKQQLQHLLLIVCSGCLLTSLLFFSSAHPAIKV